MPVSYTHLDVYKRQVQSIKLILWNFGIDTLESAFIRKINVHITVFEFVVCAEQEIREKQFQKFCGGMNALLQIIIAVSYTHLDVYKRQTITNAIFSRTRVIP